jgi:DoxX-like family
MGLPQWVSPTIGGAEIVAAVLFLLPKVDRIGGYSLLVIFAVAATLHVLHGQFEIGPLFVYGAAVFMCTSAND